MLDTQKLVADSLTQKTAQKRPYQHLKGGITFGETTEFSPKPNEDELNTDSNTKNAPYSKTSLRISMPVKSSLAASKRRNKPNECAKSKTSRLQSKPREWPSTDIANQFAKPGLQYQTKLKPAKKLLFNGKCEPDSFDSESTSIKVVKDKEGILNQAPKDVDKIY